MASGAGCQSERTEECNVPAREGSGVRIDLLRSGNHATSVSDGPFMVDEAMASELRAGENGGGTCSTPRTEGVDIQRWFEFRAENRSNA